MLSIRKAGGLFFLLLLLFPQYAGASELAIVCERFRREGIQINVENIPQEVLEKVLRAANLDPNTPRNQIDWTKVCSTGQDPITAENKVELELEYLATNDGGEFRIKLPLSFGYAKNQTITIEPTVVGTSLTEENEWGLGDLVFKYLIVPYYNEQAKWWPIGMGFRFDLTIPTGNIDRGTGGGAFILNPRIILGWRPFKNFKIFPTFKYFHSIGVDSMAATVRTLSVEIEMVYDLPLRFFISAAPEFFFRFSSNEATLTQQFKFGKMIFKRYGAYIEYELIGVNRLNLDGSLPTQGFNHKVLIANQFLF